MAGWGVSVIVGWTDLHDVATRPINLMLGRTWTGSLFGGEINIRELTVSLLSLC